MGHDLDHRTRQRRAVLIGLLPVNLFGAVKAGSFLAVTSGMDQGSWLTTAAGLTVGLALEWLTWTLAHDDNDLWWAPTGFITAFAVAVAVLEAIGEPSLSAFAPWLVAAVPLLPMVVFMYWRDGDKASQGRITASQLGERLSQLTGQVRMRELDIVSAENRFTALVQEEDMLRGRVASLAESLAYGLAAVRFGELRSVWREELEGAGLPRATAYRLLARLETKSRLLLTDVDTEETLEVTLVGALRHAGVETIRD